MNQLKTKSKVILSLIFAFVMGMSVLGTMLFLNNKSEEVTYSSVSAEQTEQDDSETVYEYWEDVQNDSSGSGYKYEESGTNLYIWNESGLAHFMGELNKNSTYQTANVWLLNNLDLSSKVWTPIGKESSKAFKGTFDGLGHTVYGITINKTIITANNVNAGLFGYLYGTVQNLILEGANIDVSAASYTGVHAGVLAGCISGNSKIVNCGSTGFVYGKEYTGGLVGNMTSGTVNFENSFSYTNVSSTSSSGGILGKKSGGNTLTFNRCFYSGTVSSNYGIIGSISGTVNIYDCYTTTTSLSSSVTAQYTVKQNSDAWYNITSAGSGIIQGTKRGSSDANAYYILKGVGNAFVEVTKQTYGATSSVSGWYLRNIVSGDSIQDGSLVKSGVVTAQDNYNFPAVTVERVSGYGDVGKEVGSGTTTSNFTFVDDKNNKPSNFWRPGTIASSKWYTSGSIDQYIKSGSKINFKEVDFGTIAQNASAPDFSSTSSTFTKNITPLNFSSGDTSSYDLNMPFLGCYYKLTAYERSKWQKVTLQFYEYDSVTDANPDALSSSITGRVEFAQKYSEWLTTINGYEDPLNISGTYADFTKTKDVYVPFKEAYTVYFSGDGFTKYTNRYALGLTDFGDIEKCKTRSDTSYVRKARDTAADLTDKYYFDNIQIVELDLNISSYTSFKKFGYDSDGSQNLPCFVGTSYVPLTSTDSVKIRVLAGKSFDDAAFSDNYTSILSSGVYNVKSKKVPVWMTFECTGFTDKADKNSTGATWWMQSSSGGNVATQLTLTGEIWEKESPGKNGEGGKLYAQWASVGNGASDRVDVSLMTDDWNTKLADSNTPYSSTSGTSWKSYIATKSDPLSPSVSVAGGTATGFEGVFAKRSGSGLIGLASGLVTTSDQGKIVIRILPKAGYSISKIRIVPENGVGQAYIIEDATKASSTTFSFKYGKVGASGAPASSAIVVNNRYKLELVDGVEVKLTLDNLMYIDRIDFGFKPATYKNLELVTSTGQAADDMPAKAKAVAYTLESPDGTELQEQLFNNNSSKYAYKFDATFNGSYSAITDVRYKTTFLITIQDGYHFSDEISVNNVTLVGTTLKPGSYVSITDVKYNGKNNNRTISTTLTFTFIIKAYSYNINNIRIQVPVERNSANLVFKVNGVDNKNLTGNVVTLGAADGSNQVKFDETSQKLTSLAKEDVNDQGMATNGSISVLSYTYWQKLAFNLNVSGIGGAGIGDYSIKVNNTDVSDSDLRNYIGINFTPTKQDTSLNLKLDSHLIVKSHNMEVTVTINVLVDEASFKVCKTFDNELRGNTFDGEFTLTWGSSMSIATDAQNHSFTLSFTDGNKPSNNGSITFDGVYDSEFSLEADNIKSILIKIKDSNDTIIGEVIVLEYNSKQKTFTSSIYKLDFINTSSSKYFVKKTDGSGACEPVYIEINFIPKTTKLMFRKLLLGQDNKVKNTDHSNISGTTIVPDRNNKDDVLYSEQIDVTPASVVGYNLIGYLFVTSIDSITYTQGQVVDISKMISKNSAFVLDMADAKPFAELTYVVLLYQAKNYSLFFDVGSKKDLNGLEISKRLNPTNINDDGNQLEWEFGTLLPLTQFPNVLTTGEMYEFESWEVKRNGKNEFSNFNVLNYDSSNDSKPFGEPGIPKFASDFDPEDDTIHFIAKYEPKKVGYQFADELGNVQQLIEGGEVTYGEYDYTPCNVRKIEKYGHTQIGWVYDNELYISYEEPEMEPDDEHNWGTKDGVYVKVWNQKVTGVVFRPLYVAGSCEIKFDAGLGTFGGTKQYQGNVTFGDNNYTSEALLKTPAVEGDGNAEFVFAGYYVAYVGQKEYIVYSTNLNNSSIFDEDALRAGTALVFTACYELKDVKYSTEFTNWEYDGTYHDIKVKSNYTNTSITINYTYEWKKSGSSTVLTSYTENSGRTSLVKLKNVSESGTYSVKVVASYQTKPGTELSDPTFSAVTKIIEVKNVTIAKRELYFTENGVRVSVLAKVFDNTKNISNVYEVANKINTEPVTMTATYRDVNVGNNKPLDIILSDTVNYYYNTEIVGEITKYVVVIQIFPLAYTYKIPGSDNNKKITLTKGVHYDITEQSAMYLANVLSASLSMQICTVQNVVGVYTQANNKLEIVKSPVTNPASIEPNLDYRIEGSFEIKNPDANSLTVKLQVVCDDGVSINLAEISSLTLVSPTSSIDPTLVVDVQDPNYIAIINTKSYFENKQIVFDVDLLHSKYWIDSVKVDDVPKDILSGKRISYTITNTSPSVISIKVYITRLNVVQYNYNLASGESIADMLTFTKFAKGLSIQDSINTYGAVLPTVTRPGWIFNGWQNGAMIVDESTIWEMGDATLIANYTLAPLQVEQFINTVKKSPMISMIDPEYIAQDNIIVYSVVNVNTKSITYTYKWTKDITTVLSNTTDTLKVKNVNQNGHYKVEISAKSGTQTQSVSYEIDVEIRAINLFENGYKITKPYDKTSTTGTITILSLGEELSVVGSYVGVNAGSVISKDPADWRINGSPAKSCTNYTLNFDDLHSESKITKRGVEISIGDLTKEYDGDVYQVKNTFSDEAVSFEYVIKTTSANVGTYTQSSDKLYVKISKGDDDKNFNITVVGSITINPAVISGIEFIGDKNVVYDGRAHAINPIVPSYVEILKVVYTRAGETITVDYENNHGGESLDYVCGVVNTGVYSVSFTIPSGGNYTLGSGTTSTIKISKRQIFVDSSTEYTKEYDGTTQVQGVVTPNIWADYGTVRLEDVVAESAMPELLFAYENPTACQTSSEVKRIYVSLVDTNNYSLSELHSTLNGKITKRLTKVVVASEQGDPATKVYDAQSFVVDAGEYLQFTNLVPEQSASGSVKFIPIVNAGIYNNVELYTNSQIDLSSLKINSKRAIENYDFEFVNSAVIESVRYDSKLIVNKAIVTIENNNKTQQGAISYIYSGVGIVVDFDYLYSTSTALPVKEDISVSFKSNGSILSEAPIVVGTYTYSLALSSTDAVNFELSGDAQNVGFEIKQRKIRVDFEKVFIYDNKTFEYSSEEYPTDVVIKVIDDYLDIPAVDSFSWSFTTVKTRTTDGVDISDVGIYYVNDDSDVIKVYSMTNGSTDRTNNYHVYFYENAVIRVDRKQINKSDISVKNSGSVYDSNTKSITVEIDGRQYTYGDGNDVVTFTNITRTNSIGTVAISESSEIKYQGKYTFRLAFANYEVAYSGSSQDFEYVIVAKEIAAMIKPEDLNKEYDGTVATKQVTLIGVENDDMIDVIAVGEYAQSNVGDNIAITVTLTASNATVQAQLRLASYSLKPDNYAGNITKKLLKFTLISDKNVYYTGNNVEIGASEFNINTVNSEIITGTILIKKSDAGTYNLATLSVGDVVFNISDNASNYEYSYASLIGTLVIQKAEIFVSVAENVKYYNANIQTASVTPLLYQEHGVIVDGVNLLDVKYYTDTTLSQAVEPINAGNYYIYISVINNNYTLTFGGNNVSAHFANEQLQINKREVNVYVASESYVYTGNKAEYIATNANARDLTEGSIGGLVSGHTISAQLLTNSAKAGKYQIENVVFTALDDTTKPVYPHSVQVLQNGTDVTSNYTISYTALIYIVADLGEVDASVIQDIVYKATNVTASNNFFIKFEYEIQQYTIMYGQTIDVGSNGYKATLDSLKAANGASVSEAVDIGEYRMSLRIYNTIDSNLDIEPVVVSFNIIQKAIQYISYTSDKTYDGTSYIVGDITSSDICVNDLDYVKIVGYYDNNGTRATNVGSYKVIFELASKVAGNEKYLNYYIVDKSYTGKITKQALNLQLSSAISIYYTGTNYTIPVSSFVAYKSGTNTVVNEVIGSLTGNFTVKQVNAGTYNLSSLYPDNVIQNVNAVSGSSVLQNYEIVSLSGEFTILPCEVSVSVINRSVEYNAEAQQATFTYQAVTNKGSILEAERADLVVAMYNGSVTLPVNAGTYALTMKINDSYSNNYRLVEVNYGNFEITKKDISISIENNYEATYFGEKIKYYISAKNVNGIIAGHDAVGYFETDNEEVGLYTYGNSPNGVTFESSAFDILESGVSVKANYNITGYAGSIKIVGINVGEIDTAHIDSLVYSATNYATTGDVFVIARFSIGSTPKTVKFILNDTTNQDGLLSGSTDITNAGNYTIYLTINSTTTTNEPISFTILQKDITVASFTHDKEFDGNANVLEPITSNDICVADKDDAVLHATYDSADKGTNKPISFTITGSKSANYNIAPLAGLYTGDITAKAITIAYTDTTVIYYTGSPLNIQTSGFDIIGVDQNGHEIDISSTASGYVIFNMLLAGTYNLAEQLSNIDLTYLRVAPNYDVTGVTGTFVINKAVLSVTVTDLTTTYNGAVQTPTIGCAIDGNKGYLENADSALEIMYIYSNNKEISEPVDADEYTINIKVVDSANYTVSYGGNLVSEFNYSSKFVINKKDINILVSGIKSFDYSGSPAVYTLVNADVNGLVSGHNIDGTLTTSDKVGGTYTYIASPASTDKYLTDDIKVKSGSQDVTKNYDTENMSIIAEIHIKSKFADAFVYRQTYQYDGTEKTIIVSLKIDDITHDYLLDSPECLFSEFKYNGNTYSLSDFKVVNVGEYSFKASVTKNDNSITETIKFNVTEKVIDNIHFDAMNNKTQKVEKEYDGTVSVVGRVSSDCIVSKNGIEDKVTINAFYDSANAGENIIIVSLSGPDSYNYIIDPTLVINGKILERKITLSIVPGVTYEFNNTYPNILTTDLTLLSGELVSGQVLGGYIKLNKIDADIYNFATSIDTSTLTIMALSENVIANYAITYSGNVQIAPRIVVLSVQDGALDLEYSGQVKNIKPLLESDVINQNNLPALADSALEVSYNKTPLDAGNYMATVSSNSANFTFIIEGGVSKNFTIAKKALQLNIGENEVIYNPTSDFITNISPDSLIGLVSGQAVQGVYKVSVVGANAGVYRFDNNNPKLVVEGLQIVVNGEDILNKNYDFAEEKLGQLTIIAKQLSVDEVWLKTTESVYAGRDIIEKIVICFVDSNGTTQNITSGDNTYGSFTVLEGQLIDAGEYTIVPTINNYNLDSVIDLKYTITKKAIHSIFYEADKEYDGNSDVFNSSGTTRLHSGNIFASDTEKVFISANYCDTNSNPIIDAGRHEIVFTKTGDATKCANYEISVSVVYGNITPKAVTLTCTDVQFVYNPTGSYRFDIENSMFNGLLASDVASGYITVNKVDYVGAVDLADVDLANVQIKNGSKSVEGNYEVTFVGSVQIQKAMIEVDFAGIENSYVYSKNAVTIQPQIQVKDDVSSELPEIALSYLDLTNNFVLANAPKDVGNYRAVFELGSEFYEFDTASTFDFAITQRNFELTEDDIPVNSFTKAYKEQDPSLVFDINSPLSEVIVVTFQRVAGEEIGGYDVSIKSYDNSNYQLSLASGVGTKLFKILKAGILNVTILDTANNIALLQKEYDNLPISVIDISNLDYEANDEVVTGTLTFGNGTTQVGTYNLASYELETDNYGEVRVVCELTFAITPKAIKIVAVNATKVYDASTLYAGEFEIRDTHDNVLSGYPLTISGAYAQAQVGENIKVTLSYSNDSVDNYDITDLAYGNITKRSVTVTPNQDQFIVYGTESYSIAYSIQDNGSTDFMGDLQNEIVGDLEIRHKAGKDKYIVGEYPIYSNLTAENLEISFTNDVIFKVTTKEITIVSQESLTKIYDGTTAVLQELSIEGLLVGDEVTVTANYEDAVVGTNKVVIFTLGGADKDNYFASDVVGDITEKFVTVVYEYVQQDMINDDLIKNNLTAQDRLVYSQTVAYSIGELPHPTHEGYEFAGWYLDSNYTVLITNETVINESIWDVDNDEMTAYAKWTIKTFMLNIHVMTRQNGLYKESNVGGTHANISGLYDYYEVVSLEGCAVANNGYEFIGYSAEAELLPDESYLSNGIRILAKESNLYAKFDPLMIEIVLDANGGVFERSGEWIFDEYNTTARVKVEYNNVLGQNMPRANKDGYEQVYTSWIGEDEASYNPTIDTIISDVWDYSAQLILKVDYTARSYYLILNAGGGFFENYSSDWTKVDVDLEQRATTISKQVTFNEAIGEIVIPGRLGYTFDCWSIDNFDASYVWNFIDDEVVTAQWTEDSHTITISSTHGYIDVKVYGMGGDVLITSEKVVSGSTVEVTALTTNIIVLQVVADQGYTFDKWSATLAEFNNSQELMILPTNFYDDYTFEALYMANSNNITIVANPNANGYVRSDDVSTQGIGYAILQANTGDNVEIVAVANEGYVVSNWIVNTRFDYELSGNATDSQRILSGFVDDVTVIVVFEPKANNITIITDAIKGELYIDNIERSANYVAVVKTEEVLTFTIVAKHGYKIEMNDNAWLFDSHSNNGRLEIVEGDGYFATLTLTEFTADGTIEVPFVKDRFTITVVSVTKDLDYIIDDYDEIVNLVQDSTPSILNSNNSFEGEYESTVTLSVNEVVSGYSFSNWSLESDRMHMILADDGLISKSEDGKTIEVAILDSITIYVVYEIKTYVVKYSVNDTVRGSLTYGEFTGLESYQVSVKYGYNAPEILAATDENYYNFVEWVIVGNGDNTRVTTDKLLIVTNVTQDCEFVARFAGRPMTFTVILELDENDVFTDGEIDFAELSYVENPNSPTQIISSFTPKNNIATYIFSTYTGEDVSFEIIEKLGYEISGMTVNPRVVFTRTGTTIELSKINLQTEITVKLKAQVHQVTFRITGKQDGADIFPQSPYDAITQQELSADKKTLTLYVKTGGDANSILYTYFGYKLINNTIYTIDPMVDNVSTASPVTFYNGGLDNVVEDEEVLIEIDIVKYYVTFDLNDGTGSSYSSVVGYNRTDFDPLIPERFSSPTRDRYVFQGYNTTNIFSGDTYFFNEQGIYMLTFNSENTSTESQGFKGSSNLTLSTRPGIDYECTLYGEWALETHEVKFEFVPEFAVNKSNIDYKGMFPNSFGRYFIPDPDDRNKIVGVKYVPGERVVINSPATIDGLDYYGWSYASGLTKKSDVNVGKYDELMADSDILVYLYYTIHVDAVAQVGGTATISSKDVLFGDTTTINCVPNAGYDFGYWLQNTTQLDDSQTTMVITVTAPTTYYAVFIGKPVEVRFDTNEYAKLRVGEETTSEVYRVGDVIKIDVYDVTYGYKQVSWSGEYSNQIDTSNYYTITAEDQVRGYVKFGVVMEAKKLNIQFVIEDRIGGTFVFGGQELVNVTKEFTYDQLLSYAINIQPKYELVNVTLNDVEINASTTDVVINQANGFTVDATNVLKAKFKQMLWVEVWQMFTGQGTESDPYVIQNENQLAAMAYLINNNIESDGTIPYAQGYYVVKRHMYLGQRFWQPIGTRENPFDGTFDLSDYKVNELTLDQIYTVTNLEGLFGYITENAKFITKAKNYTAAIIIISVASALVVAAVAAIVIVVVVKRKKMKKLQVNSNISAENLKGIEKDDN